VAKGYFEPQEKAVCDKSEFGITANIWPRERVVVYVLRADGTKLGTW